MVQILFRKIAKYGIMLYLLLLFVPWVYPTADILANIESVSNMRVVLIENRYPAIVYEMRKIKPRVEGTETVGQTLAVFVKFKKGYDQLARIHEFEHVKQYYKSFGMMPWLYSLFDSYQIKYEVGAFKADIAQTKDEKERRRKTMERAYWLTNNYELDIDYIDAVSLLTENMEMKKR